MKVKLKTKDFKDACEAFFVRRGMATRSFRGGIDADVLARRARREKTAADVAAEKAAQEMEARE